MSGFGRGGDWYCDNCDAHLNKQMGFSVFGGLWICTKCGYKNDVTETNIISGKEERLMRKLYVICPHCRAHMYSLDFEHYRCLDCGCSGRYDFNSYILNEELNLKKPQ